MKYLHTMIRSANLEKTLSFFCDGLGLIETRRYNNDSGKFTLVFLSAPDDLKSKSPSNVPLIEITFNWPNKDSQEEVLTQGRNFGHIAFGVDNIYKTCEKLVSLGITINRPPRDGYMAFIKSPDNISIELLQKGNALVVKEPWKSMKNVGDW